MLHNPLPLEGEGEGEGALLMNSLVNALECVGAAQLIIAAPVKWFVRQGFASFLAKYWSLPGFGKAESYSASHT